MRDEFQMNSTVCKKVWMLASSKTEDNYRSYVVTVRIYESPTYQEHRFVDNCP
jgi:hypothetical protein